MAIPGMKPQYDVRAKVRIGEKKTSARGSEYPSATDHFICSDSELEQLFGAKPKTIRVRFPHDEAWTTGMEWWSGKMLTCYSKGDGVALRKASIQPRGDVQGATVINLLHGHNILDPNPVGDDRRRIECRFRDCPEFGSNAQNKKCRVMGRLIFFLDGGRTDSVLEVDTKAWNSIERIEATVASVLAVGSLSGRVFELSVEMVQKGRDRFPVLSLQEVDVKINADADVARADALVAAAGALEREEDVKATLAALLDSTHPGWRENQAFIDRIKEIGAEPALRKMLEQL